MNSNWFWVWAEMFYIGGSASIRFTDYSDLSVKIDTATVIRECYLVIWAVFKYWSALFWNSENSEQLNFM